MSDSTLERLRRRRALIGAPLCLGIDPHPDRLPAGLSPGVAGVESLGRGLFEGGGAGAAAG